MMNSVDQNACEFANRVSENVIALLERTWHIVIEPSYQHIMQEDVWEKTGGELVTAIDVASEAYIRTELCALMPDAAFLGEETEQPEDAACGLCWVVDPLDGTANFIHGDPNFALIIALLSDGSPVAGWAIAPAKQTAFWAIRGHGAFINGVRVQSARGEAGKTLRIVVAARLKRTQQNVDQDEASVRIQVPSSAAIQYLELVSGKFDAAIFDRARPWDHMAGAVFVEEAGGVCARPEGEEFRLNDGGFGLIAARDPACWEIAATTLYHSGDHLDLCHLPTEDPNSIQRGR